MNVLCFGSLNIDYTYRVPHFVKKGETLSSESLQVFCGGKGFNQAVAFARAGAQTYLAGAVGPDGLFLLDRLKEAGVDSRFVSVLNDQKTGHAIIQNDAEGDNCILLYGGANQSITRPQIDEVLAHFQPGDFLALQNEINELPYLMERAHEKGLRIVLNPSPMNQAILALPLGLVDFFILNQVEASQLLGQETPAAPEEQLGALQARFPRATVVLTLGEQGSLYQENGRRWTQPIFPVRAVDTTAAGDTFTGFLFAALLRGENVSAAMSLAAKASAIAVTRPGASPSIPTLAEVAAWKGEQA